MILHRRSQAA
jgi:hypothetical protein